MKGVDAVARILQKEGVEYLFSYPNHPLIEAAAKIGIRPIIARSEKTLINIADGYTRALNATRPTVIVVQGGPGIENAFGGLAQAASDGVPILTIPGGGEARRLGSGEFDPLPVYNHIMKWTGRINLPERIPELMGRAFSQLRNGKLGPVLLELPRDTGGAEADESAVEAYQTRRKYRSAGDAGDVAEAARMLVSAQRPVLHAGHGVLWAEAWDELRELAELLQIPVVTTMAGKSAFPEDHPLSLGAGGHSMTQTSAEFLVKSDLVFGVGASFAKGAFSYPVPAGKKIVQIVADGRDLDKDYTTDYAVIGDAKLVLRQLIDEVKATGAKPRDGVADEVRSAKNAFLDEWLPRLTADTAPISPYRVIWDVMHTVDRRQTVITHDSGNPRDQTLPFFEAVAPRGYLGWGKSTQLGTGYGVAMGAKLAFPDKLCINVMGDLAFGTAGMEIETAFREKLPIMTVLLNNSVLGGYSNYMPVASEKFNSNKLTGDYTAVAKGLGAYAEKVERPEDVKGAVERGVQATREGRPVLLEFVTREEPIFPDSNRVLKEITERELARV